LPELVEGDGTGCSFDKFSQHCRFSGLVEGGGAGCSFDKFSQRCRFPEPVELKAEVYGID
jgi:hypothetical protein